ncbi:Arm DNA-binding domain-containing protein [Nubsella zeaxanthinifaciens]|uniref:Arm DNA-binding domain-containing protein n=1 Tax=Nubsella zeaxanthinifaciens TaxID=392412 RepID=UPI003CFC0279
MKKNEPKKNGNVPVMGRITIDGIPKSFSTKLDINPNNWDLIGSVISMHCKPFLNAIFLASSFILSKDPYAFLSHFKSKGISVFLTHHKGRM